MTRHDLNAKGLLCPLPVLRARKALKPLAAGDTLMVEATDIAAPADFAAYCTATGNRLLSSEREGNVFRIELEKTEARTETRADG
ncbi:MAG: sulfurtransferase TusA family protein [Rhodospirillaceae bacterium]